MLKNAKKIDTYVERVDAIAKLAPLIRWCCQGDTISTVRPMSQYDGLRPNQHLHAIPNTPEACAEANELIMSGRWRVSRCGQCGKAVEECGCK